MGNSNFRNISLSFLRASSQYKKLLAELLVPYNISVLQMETLIILNENNCTIGIEFIKSNLTQSGVDVSRMIDELLKKGFVTRIQSQLDRRAIQITLTSKGKSITNEIDTESFESYILNGFNNAELDQLSKYLMKIINETKQRTLLNIKT